MDTPKIPLNALRLDREHIIIGFYVATHIELQIHLKWMDFFLNKYHFINKRFVVSGFRAKIPKENKHWPHNRDSTAHHKSIKMIYISIFGNRSCSCPKYYCYLGEGDKASRNATVLSNKRSNMLLSFHIFDFHNRIDLLNYLWHKLSLKRENISLSIDEPYIRLNGGDDQ